MYKKLSAASIVFILLGCANSNSSSKVNSRRGRDLEKLKINLLDPQLEYQNLDEGLENATASLNLGWRLTGICGEQTTTNYEVEIYEVDDEDNFLNLFKKVETSANYVDVQNLEVGKKYNVVIKGNIDALLLNAETSITTIPQAELNIADAEDGGGAYITFKNTYKGIDYYLSETKLYKTELEKGVTKNASIMLEQTVVVSFHEEINGIKNKARIFHIKTNNKRYLDSIKSARNTIEKIRKRQRVAPLEMFNLVRYWENQYLHITGVVFELRINKYIPNELQDFDSKLSRLKKMYHEAIEILKPIVSKDKLSNDSQALGNANSFQKVLDCITKYERFRDEIAGDIYNYCINYNKDLEEILKGTYNFNISTTADEDNKIGVSITYHSVFNRIKKFFDDNNKISREMKLKELLSKNSSLLICFLKGLNQDEKINTILNSMLSDEEEAIKETAKKFKDALDSIYKEACKIEDLNTINLYNNKDVINLLKNDIIPFIKKYNDLCDLFEVENKSILAINVKLKGNDDFKYHTLYINTEDFIGNLQFKLRNNLVKMTEESLKTSFDLEKSIDIIVDFYKEELKKNIYILEFIPDLYNSNVIDELVEIIGKFEKMANINENAKDLKYTEILNFYRELFNLLNFKESNLDFPVALDNFMSPVDTKNIYDKSNAKLDLKEFLKKVLKELKLDEKDVEKRTGARKSALRRSGSKEVFETKIKEYRVSDYSLKEILNKALIKYRANKKRLGDDANQLDIHPLSKDEKKIIRKIIDKMEDSYFALKKKDSTEKLKKGLKLINNYLNPEAESKKLENSPSRILSRKNSSNASFQRQESIQRTGSKKTIV